MIGRIIVYVVLILAFVQVAQSYVSDEASNAESIHIGQITLDDVLKAIGDNKKVVFIDAREMAEYQEGHIPGAMRMPLRDINNENVSRIPEGDIVIAYCLKDFRGFETAKALSRKGLKNVYVMKPHGLNAWKKHNLPLAKGGKNQEQVAVTKLKSCASDLKSCTEKRREG